MKTRKRQASLLAIGLGGVLLAAAACAAPLADRLERPAQPVANAGRTPLTDAQRVGQDLVMVGQDGHILLRTATGQLLQARVPVDLLLTAVHFVDARRGWAVGHDGVVLHSDDGGRNWSKQLDGGTINALMLDWARGEVARLQQASAAAPQDERLQAALEDARFALDDAEAGARAGAARPLLDVWFRSAEEGWVVGAYGMILHSADGGRSWSFETGLENPDRLHLNAVLGLADGSLLVAGEGGRLYRRSDGRWQPVQQLTQASLYHLLPLRDGRLLAMGFGGALFASDDHGASWQALPVPVKGSLYGGEQLADGSVLLTGQAGLLLHARDARTFRAWQSGSKAPWLAAVELEGGQLALAGGAGLAILPLGEIEEQLK